MYTNNMYDRYAIPTSDIERSRRYGAGIYPDYSRGYPVRHNIAHTGTSSEQRNMQQARQEASTSRDSVAANIKNIPANNNDAGKESPSSSASVQPSVSYQLNLGNVIANLNNPDPFQAFILNPHDSNAEDEMFKALACKDLPLYLREVEFDDWLMEQVRNLLGILCKYIRPEDKKLFNKLCASLKKVEGDINKEVPLGNDVAFLLHKYGKAPLYNHVETYLECCRKVWHYYNPGHTAHPSDEDIFTESSVCCLEITHAALLRLIRPKQSWGDVTAIGVNFKNSCGALGLTIKINPEVTISAESITETFASVYLNDRGSATAPDNSNNHDAESIDSTRSQSVWQNVANIFCCGI